MGSMYAEGLARAALKERAAMQAHLTYNHYPPVPTDWVEPCVMVVDELAQAAEGGDVPEELWDRTLDNPVRPGEKVTYRQLFEALHLDVFVSAKLHGG